MRYQRVLLKLSGQAIAGDQEVGFSAPALEHIADEVLALRALQVQVAVVIGGGNIFRGPLGEQWGIERAEADNIGMMGTVINSLMLRGVLSARARGATEVRVMTAVPINTVAEPFIRLRAIHHLEKGCVVILAGGTGNPYVTTDYTAALRAMELRAQALLFAKNRARGIYTADPQVDPGARFYRRVHYDTIIQRNLRAVDQPCVLLARDNRLPLHIFDFSERGTCVRICQGEDLGTLVADVARDELE